MSLITIEKYYQDYLWILATESIENAHIDAWEAAVRAYIQHFNHADNRYLIYDLTAVPKVGFTNYMRERVTALAKDNPKAIGRVGIVMNINPTLLFIFEPFVRLTGSRYQPHLQVRFFNQRQEAFQWVAAALPEKLRL
jgi:hypothetical protein